MKKRYWIPLLVIVLIIVGLHFALEPLALRQVNRALANMEGYRGKVGDIKIHLFRGAYQIDSIVIINEKQQDEQDYFFSAGTIDIGLEWRSLFRGEIVSDIQVDRPVLNFISDGEEVDDAEGVNLEEVLNELVPITINTFTIRNGEIHYIDRTASPQIDVFMRDLDIHANNLGNVNLEGQALPASIVLSGTTIGDGVFEGNVDLNIMKVKPDFDANLEVDKMNLVALNEFTEAYANFTFEEGEMYISTEVAMKDGIFQGYLKPIFENVRILDLQSEDTSFWRKAWEAVVGATVAIFTNPKTGRFATEVPFEGNTNETDVKVLPTIFNVLRNTFIEAFEKNLKNSIRYEDIKPSE